MGIIRLKDIRVYSNHGCMSEEEAIGQEFIADVTLHTDMEKSFESDALEDTVDYVAVHHIVFRETRIRSKLIEHVAVRIADALKRELGGIETVTVELKKPAPPIGGDVGYVSVEITR